MFNPVSPKVDVQTVEEEQLAFWREHDIFQRTMSERAEGPRYVFFEGPPTANGRPGSHHVLARAFKDMFPRYKTMRGYYVLRKGGWDTHGLPVEIEVEKELGIEHKWQVEEYGIDRFNQKCKESVFRYIKEWEELTERIAFWVDLDKAYVTFTQDYVQSVWWILRQYWDQNLLYQGYKVVPYCPRCGTPLSSHEVNQGYKDDTPDPSIFVRFRIAEPGFDVPTYFLVWTTTPWTLPGNVALAVGKDVKYVKVEGKNGKGKTEHLILAEALLKYALDERVGEYKVIEQFQGKDLIDWQYEPLYTFLPVDKKYCYVVPGDFVSTEEGTGIVHMAPAFGADDMEMGIKFDLPVLMTVKPDGGFVDEVEPWAGVWVKDADPQIIEELVGRGLMFRHGTYYHTYPFCWRCDTALLYYARPTWFIRTTERRENLVNLNKTINWVPEHIRDGRFGDWLDGNIDWALGRERFWGTPLPVWECDQCGHQHCIGGLDELTELTGEDQSELDPHRPYVDEITWECSECEGGTMKRVPELIDVWFDSGAMPVAQWGYPYYNQEMFKEQFPADFICEAVDQTRGWFYSLHAISTLLFDSVCFKNVICLGHILDGEGQKMSKTKGNVVAPWDVLNAYGADCFRWYMYTAGPPGEPRRFSLELVGQAYRSFWLTLWNTYSFFVTYAALDEFNPTTVDVPYEDRSALDRWALSELHSLVRNVTEAFENYDVPGATRPIVDFIDSLSNWYLRRSRRRFWKSESDTDKQSAYLTLYECLVTVSKLLAPTMPFVSEAIYRNLVTTVDKDAPESVHLASWPEFEERLVDQPLMDEMQTVMRLVSLGHAARNNAQIKVRQPLSEVVFSLPAAQAETVRYYDALIADELNVKAVGILDEPGDVVTYKLNPLPKVLGPRFGKDFPAIQKLLREGESRRYAEALLEGQAITVSFDGRDIEMTPEEIEVQLSPAEGFAVAKEGAYLAALNIVLDDDLLAEGLAREFIRRVQTLRRDADYNVDDRIVVLYKASEKLGQAVEQFEDLIKNETLALKLDPGEPVTADQKGEYTFDGETLQVGVKKA
ncbi:MAG: isoleucine--tRNA ligase [Anaerolineae bacterium]|nr:isoleucine--tRNA ligase [Anaerolineae bacterium]